ncbi:hypothetical protein BASA83_008480 [Batrachochytrium salamandrivorans]|nr:hypothetical protein BASA83_008480 [Batrachochytrium salamandrivorans]
MDVLDGVAPISVPGLSQEHHPRGLMFADDIAIIAPSHESLCTSMGTIADWATRWEMSFGVAKCGIMHVAPIPATTVKDYDSVIITTTFTTIPITPNHLRNPTPALQVCIRAYISKSGASPNWPAAMCRRTRASSVKFLRSPALSTGQAIGASLLSLARCGGLWDYPRALKAGLLAPYSNKPRPAGHSPQVPLSVCLQVPLAAPLIFQFFHFFNFLPHTRFEPPISVAHSEIPRQVQDTVEENPTASRTTTTDTHTAAISSTPTPTHISYIGSDDILTVLLGGSLPGTNTAGNTEACPGQQWLTGTVEEGNLLSSNQPVAHRMCDFLQISVRVYRAMLWKHHKSNLSHIPDI